MRLVLGVLSLLFVVSVIGVLVKKQLGATPAGVSLPVGTPQQQSQQLQNEVKKSVEAAMQQARPEQDDK